MFYIPLLVLALVVVAHYASLKEKETHDIYLFPFCQARRDAMQYLNDNYSKLNQRDYKILREVIDALGIVIKHYKKYKTILFNYRLFMRMVSEINQSSNELGALKTKNKDIQVIIFRVRYYLRSAFLVYTPFLRSELFFKMLYRVANAAVTLGLSKFSFFVTKLDEARVLASQVKGESSRLAA